MVPGIEQGAKTARPEGRGCPARSVTQIKERKYRRPTCSAGVPTTLTHRSSDLTDDLGESQFGAVGGGIQFGVSQHQTSHCHHATGQEVTVSLCESIPAPSHQCHLLVSYITLLPPYYSHCVSMPPYHNITMSHSPCISVTTSHCHHVTCHHCLSWVLQIQLIAAENKTWEGVIHSQ